MNKRSFLLILTVISFGLGGAGLLAYLLDFIFKTDAIFSKQQIIQFVVLVGAGFFFLTIRGKEKE